jgi:hypothetical protein
VSFSSSTFGLDEYLPEGINIAITASNITLAFNVGANTATSSMLVKITFSGTGLAEIWEYIVPELEEEGLTVEGYTATGTMSESGTIQEVAGDLLELDMQINQDGTKLKVPASEYNTSELILTKQ